MLTAKKKQEIVRKAKKNLVAFRKIILSNDEEKELLSADFLATE